MIQVFLQACDILQAFHGVVGDCWYKFASAIFMVITVFKALQKLELKSPAKIF